METAHAFCGYLELRVKQTTGANPTTFYGFTTVDIELEDPF